MAGPSCSPLAIVDSGTIDIGISEQNRTQTCKKLAGFLASTYTLYMKTLFYHWNVTGPHFYSLHTMLEKQYQNLHEAGDRIAERIRALGHFTPGTYKEYAELSSIIEDDALPDTGMQMIKNLLKAHEICSRRAREVLEVAERSGDAVTTDLMIRRMSFHDQTAWMLRAIAE